MFEARSALAQVLPRSGRDGVDGRRALQLGEVPLGSLVQLGFHAARNAEVAADAGPAAALAAAAAVLGGPLPHSPVEAALLGPHRLFRIARDQVLIRTPESGLAQRLRAALTPAAASITPLDGARTCIALCGPAVRELLARLVAVDLHPAVFAVGHFAQTPIHHVGGLLHRRAADAYEFLALRTYAQATWEVIEDAARSFGYDLITPDLQ